VRQHNFDRDVDWTLVRDGSTLEALAREIADVKMLGHDVEADGLNPWKGNRIVGHSFAWRQANGRMKAAYVPCRHEAPGHELFEDATQLPPEMVSAAVKSALESPDILKVGHNYKFDIHMSRPDGINVAGPVACSLIACKLINENWHSHKLPMCLTMAGLPHEKGWKNQVTLELQRLGKRMKMGPTAVAEKYGYKFISIPTLGRYACQDAAYELRLAEWAIPQQNEWQAIWDMEMRLIWVCLAMEDKGVPLDADHLLRIAARERLVLADLEPKIYAAAGVEWDLSKDAQTREVLFNKLGRKVQRETKSGPSVDDDTLWALEQGGCNVAPLLRKWNASDKIVSTYTEGIVAHQDSHGILHAQIDQSAAKTGRFGSRAPNLQNIPVRTALGREIRQAFLARDGMVRYCLDYSQVELRILAHLSKDPLLLKIYREGLDAHSISALEAFGTDQKVGGIDMRRVAKILNFGTTFGMTEIGFQRNVNKDLPPGIPPVTEKQAIQFQQQFYSKYPGVVAFRHHLWMQIAAHPEHKFYNLFGRPRRFPGWGRGSRGAQNAMKRQAPASAVQGSAADLVKFSMVAVYDYLQSQQDCETDLVLMVHDDLQFDMQPSGSAKVIREVKGIMEETCQSRLVVPIVVDTEFFTTNWADKHKMEL
jgi:DNA polymerase-1